MKLLALATPFTGIARIHNMLNDAGYRVGLETMGHDGMIRCMLIGELVYMEGWDYIIHVVCNPLHTLDKLKTMSDSRSAKLRWAQSVWADTNSAIAYKATHRLRIEHVKDDWPLQLYKPKKFTRYRYLSRPLAISKIDNSVVLELAKEYGYEL